MTQRDRDRLVVLKHAQKRQITQQQAGEQLGCTERHVRRLLKKLKGEGDKAIFHGLRGRPSNRRRNAKEREAIVRILSQESLCNAASGSYPFPSGGSQELPGEVDAVQ